ncbi:MAG: hypothetical protein AABX33_04865 [Nanoarchaeota archaeon]
MIYRKSVYSKYLIVIVLIFSVFSIIGCTANENQFRSEISPPKETAKKIEPEQKNGKIVKIFEDDTISDFDIWGDKIVFLGGGKKYDWAIYLYDIPTNELKRITYDSSSKRTPLIYNDLIFWNDERFVDNNIFMYNISSGKEKSLFQRLWVFDNFEDTLFVLDGFSGRWYLKFLEEDKSIDLPEEFKDMDYYNIYDNKIMLTKSHGTISTVDYVIPLRNILYYNFLANKFVQVTNNTLDEKYPHIYKNKIVWSDNRNGKFNYDIYLYDLDTKQETQITSQQDTNELYPLIYGDYIVYLKSGKEKSIYLYNIKTKKEIKIPEKASLIGEKPLKIYDNKVLWHTCKEDRCEDEELYLYII